MTDINQFDDSGFCEPDGSLTFKGQSFVWAFIYNFAPAIKKGLITASFKQDGQTLVSIDSLSDAVGFIESYLIDKPKDELPNEFEKSSCSAAPFLKDYLLDTIKPTTIVWQDREIANLFVDTTAQSRLTYACRSIGMRVSSPWPKDFRLGYGTVCFLLEIMDPEANKLLRRLEQADHLSWASDIVDLRGKQPPELQLQQFLRQETRRILAESAGAKDDNPVEVTNVDLLGLTGERNRTTDLYMRPKSLSFGANSEPGDPNPPPPKRNKRSKGDDPTEVALRIPCRTIAVDPENGEYLFRFKAPSEPYCSITLETKCLLSDSESEGSTLLNIDKLLEVKGAEASRLSSGIRLFNFEPNASISIRLKFIEDQMSAVKAVFNGEK